MCDSGVFPPKMEVTFSMSKLKAIDHNCRIYIDSMDAMAKKIREQREKKASDDSFVEPIAARENTFHPMKMF